MQDIYKVAGLTRQAYFKCLKKELTSYAITDQVVTAIQAMRENHKKMSCRKVYYTLEDPPVGRDKFVKIGFDCGYKVKIKRNVFKTTFSQTKKVYPNLLAGKELNGINQAWSSDIFCIVQSNKPIAYGIKIMDVYSRKILALEISRSQSALDTIKALKKAVKVRKGQDIINCIFHSDRGSQYISKIHERYLACHKMIPSMGILAQENPYSERLNGIIKNDYIYELIQPDTHLNKLVTKIVNLYNNQRPHSSLDNITPDAFEQYVQNLPEKDRPIEYVYQVVTELSQTRKVINKKKKDAKKKILR